MKIIIPEEFQISAGIPEEWDEEWSEEDDKCCSETWSEEDDWLSKLSSIWSVFCLLAYILRSGRSSLHVTLFSFSWDDSDFFSVCSFGVERVYEIRGLLNIGTPISSCSNNFSPWVGALGSLKYASASLKVTFLLTKFFLEIGW